MVDWLDLPTIFPEHGIAKLRANMNFSRYEAKPDSPRWMHCLASQAKADLGVLGLLGPSGISVATENGHIRPDLDQPCLYLAGLSDYLRRSGRRLSIGVPPAAMHLPLLLAASAVLANTFDRALGKQRGGILIVSPNLDLRSRYCDLFVRQEPIDTAHPGSRLRPTGEHVMLRPKTELTDEGVCFFLPGLALPPNVKIRPDLIILDLRFGRLVRRASDLSRWAAGLRKDAGVIGLYTVGDRETLLALRSGGFDDFPLDHRAIATCINKSGGGPLHEVESDVDWQLHSSPGFLDRRHELHAIGQPALNERFSQIVKLFDTHAKAQSPDLNRARWLLATLTQLPVPVAWYDGAASILGRSTLSKLIEGVGARTRGGDGLGAVYQSLKLLLSVLHGEIYKTNPRSEALKNLLPNLISSPSSGAWQVLVRDRVSAHSLETWLAVEAFPGKAWLSRLQVQTCGSYSHPPPTALVGTLVNGAFPWRYRWLAGAALGKRVHFLAYPHETDSIWSQLNAIYSEHAGQNRRSKRESTVSHLLMCQIERDNRPESDIQILEIKAGVQQSAKPKLHEFLPAAGALSGLANLLKESQKAAQRSDRIGEEPAWLKEVNETGDEISLFDDESGTLSPRFCVLLHLKSRSDGPGLLLIPTDGILDCMRFSKDDELLRLRAGDVKVGDVVLLMGETKRAGLFETIVDLAERQPAMEYLAAFRRRWRLALEIMASKYRSGRGIDYKRMLQDLQNEGATIQTEAAVRLWVIDQIIGPETIDSTRAVGRIASIREVAAQAGDFDRAFQKIRAIRRGIGHRLSMIIRSSFKNLTTGERSSREGALEDRLGLPLEELLDTIDIAEVIGVDIPESVIEGIPVGRFVKTSAPEIA